MPFAEILQNSAPAIGGVFVTGAALAYVHLLRRQREQRKARLCQQAHQPAE